MRGEKTTTFEHPFRYSAAGGFEEGTEITVRAPSLTRLDVHCRMQAVVIQSVIAFGQQVQRPDAKPEADAEAADAPDERKKPDDVDALALVAAGKPPQEYADFVRWLKKTLTGAKDLAFVTGTQQPITDEVWESLEEANGSEAVMSLLSDFTGFFLAALDKTKRSAAASGNGSAPTSSSVTEAVSVTRRPPASRSKN